MEFAYQAYRDAFLGAMWLATVFAAYAVSSAPTREPQRYGMRGLMRERALQAQGIFARVEPLVRWSGVRVSGLLSEPQREGLDKQLRIAGDYLGLTAEEYAGSMVLCALAGTLLGVSVGLMGGNGQLAVLFCTAFGAAFPYIVVSGEGQKRLLKIRHGLPHAIDLMTLSMSAGLDFPAAVRQVIEKASDPRDPLIEEFRHIASGLQLGRTRKQALLDFAHRAPTDSVLEFVSSVVQAEQRGNPLAEVLAIQAESLRRKRTSGAEEAASRAGVAMAGPLLLLFVSIMIIIIGPMILKLKKGF
jgi:tight adherence protein C